MHEVGLCESIMEAVERRAAGRRVLAVKVRAGDELMVAEPALDQAFVLVSEGTVAEGARIEMVPASGHELILESIEVERPCA
jgi:hydrogenase nickel incorporation protein HypA/HybF